jgi:hypothetical protein
MDQLNKEAPQPNLQQKTPRTGVSGQVPAKELQALGQTPSGSHQPSDEVDKVKQNILNAMCENKDVSKFISQDIREGLNKRETQLADNPDCMAVMPDIYQALIIMQSPDRYGYASPGVQQDRRVLKYMICCLNPFDAETQNEIVTMIENNQTVDEIWGVAAKKDPQFVLIYGPETLKMDVNCINNAMSCLDIVDDSLLHEPKAIWMHILKGDPTLFTAAPKAIREDRNAIIDITRARPALPYYLPNSLKVDLVFAKQLLQANGESWEYLSNNLKSKREMMLAALFQLCETYPNVIPFPELPERRGAAIPKIYGLNGNEVDIDTSPCLTRVDVRDKLFLKFNKEQPETIVLPQQLRLVEDGNKISVIKTDLKQLLSDAIERDKHTQNMSLIMRELVNALISKLDLESK